MTDTYKQHDITKIAHTLKESSDIIERYVFEGLVVVRTNILITPSMCNNHKDTLFLFGDNIQRKGNGGQAIIRECSNSLGIITKKLPSMDEKAFLKDDEDSFTQLNRSLIDIFIYTPLYKKVHIPIGIGKGRSKLEEKAPILYIYLRLCLGLEI